MSSAGWPLLDLPARLHGWTCAWVRRWAEGLTSAWAWAWAWACGVICTLPFVAAASAAPAPAAPTAKFTRPPGTLQVLLLVQADDPRLQRSRLERAAPGHPQGPVADAVLLAFSEAQAVLAAAGTGLQLRVQEVADAAAAAQAAGQAQKSGAVALLADLPAAALLAAVDASQLPVINVGAADDRLREANCRPQLWHTTPSERMRADALAQALLARGWSQVLLLSGPSAVDQQRSQTVLASLQRYRLKVVAQKTFKLSADPRERAAANPRLLSSGTYDVVWVVDSDGEFALSLPYRTLLPRPVVGDAGLSALAWSARFERFGAPQVTRRLARAAGRPMGAYDWPAWAAGRVLVAAAQAAPTGSAAGFAAALAKAEIDGSQGVILSFRPWDGQLRLPLLLSNGFGVIEQAPGEGVLHPRNVLDTLGADAPEKLCPRPRG